MARKDIEFRSGEDICRGWLYTPDGAKGPVPVVVLPAVGEEVAAVLQVVPGRNLNQNVRQMIRILSISFLYKSIAA